MRFDKYTIKAQEAVVRAQETAQRLDNAEILPLHLLAALLDETEGVVRPLLQKIGANVGRIQQIVTGELERLPKATGTQLGMNRVTTEVLAAVAIPAIEMRRRERDTFLDSPSMPIVPTSCSIPTKRCRGPSRASRT